MKVFFGRLFNIFTVIVTALTIGGGVSFIGSVGGSPTTFFSFMAFFYAVILGLNYLVMGKATLWNSNK